MTEVNGSGADASGNRTVVDPNANNGSDGGGQQTDWSAGLDEGNRNLVQTKGWKTPADAVNSYRALETQLGQTLTVPGENATAEDWSKFYGKLGRPEKPDGYAINIDRAKLPADMPYDETFAVEFRNWAHETGLSPKQVQTLHDKWVGKFAEGFQSSQVQQVQRQETAHREITAKWGAPESDGYKQNLELMGRAAKQLGLFDALKQGGLLTGDGGVTNSALAFALARVGKELFGEDSFATNDGGVLRNPWSKETTNLTEQGQLIRNDPNKARALMRAAGVDPARYGL